MKYIHKLKVAVMLPFVALSLIQCQSQKNNEQEGPYAKIENNLTESIQLKHAEITRHSLTERMEHYHVPGVSIAVVHNGEIVMARGYGIADSKAGSKVNTETLFQAGSISKPVAALAALKLYEEGKIHLDSNVNIYLKDWKVKDNEFTSTEKVTVRRLLTHTAGITVHGFPGYTAGNDFPDVIAVLNGQGNTPAIVVDTIPGSIWRYSGGGYTIMQKMVEDVSGMAFEDYLAQNILPGLHMTHSTFSQPLPEDMVKNASAAYDREGKLIAGFWNNYPEKAAAGLWTTPTDLANYCMAIQAIANAKTDGVLSTQTVNEMLTKHKNEWGLGPSLQWDGDSLRFQHGGKNAGFSNLLVAFANKGDAVIVMTNGDNGIKLGKELIRSISEYYDFGIEKPQLVEEHNLSKDDYDRIKGKYKWLGTTDDGKDYIVVLRNEGNRMIVDDPNNGERDELIPLDSVSFLDMSDGDRMIFSTDENEVSFMWNNRFKFEKIGEETP